MVASHKAQTFQMVHKILLRNEDFTSHAIILKKQKTPKKVSNILSYNFLINPIK